jgi:GNAT superfamily N-acetyltransferase
MDFDKHEILVELTNEEIEDFRAFYKNLNRKDLVFVHLYLKNQLLWNEKITQMSDVEAAEISDRCKMKLYRHRNGERENRTLVGITYGKDLTVFVASQDESLVELRECLMQTKLINWEKLPLFTAVNRRFHKMMYEIFEAKNVRVKIDNFCSSIWMEKKKAASYDFTVPDNVEMKNLSVDDGKRINDVWPYRYPDSERFIKSLIRLNGGIGIYDGGELVSWILKIECFGLGLLQTLDEHQGKGYARLLTRALSKQIADDDDEDVILFASYGRPKTVDLYIRYGFQHVCYTHWMYLKKNEA